MAEAVISRDISESLAYSLNRRKLLYFQRLVVGSKKNNNNIDSLIVLMIRMILIMNCLHDC